MVDTFSASPTHTHNNTTVEKRHLRKPDERNTPVEGSNMKTTQVNAGQTLSTQLRARTAKNAACRLKDLYTGRMKTARTTYVAWKLKDLHTGRTEIAQTSYTVDRETDSARREIRNKEGSVRRYRLPQSNRNNPGKSLNSFSCKNPSIHRNKQQDKSRLWNGKTAQKLMKNNHQPSQTNPGKLSDFFSRKFLKVHRINRNYEPRPRNGNGVQQLEKDSPKAHRTNPGKPTTPFS